MLALKIIIGESNFETVDPSFRYIAGTLEGGREKDYLE